MTRKPLVIVLHGPAGVGKDSIIKELRARTDIQRATSSTTRAPRKGEVDGVDYIFLTRPEFERRVADGEFAEWAHVYKDLKGLKYSEVAGPIARGEDFIIRTDVQGARAWRRMLEGAIFVFLMAADRAELRRRLIERDTETDDSLESRLAEIDEEIADMPNNDYVVYNHQDHMDDAVAEMLTIIERERVNPNRPAPRLRDEALPRKPS
ncbi:guanylate kinase [bacterium]|jgi:guanylate kinase|nr:guanylate kinase [bacterium]